MKYFGEGLSEIHKELSMVIKKKDRIEDARKLFEKLHSELHMSEVYGGEKNKIDELFENLADEEYAIMPTSKDETIAWVIWHLARIEDLTSNYLLTDGEQVFNDDWKERLNVSITDTANALNDEEIINFSHAVNKRELLNYRNEVGRRLRDIVPNMTTEDMKRKVPQSGLDRILMVGGVTEDEESIWLLDFWGKKDLAGIILMPPTRHAMLHLNDCFKWKEQIRTRKKFYRE